jgi:hypothetical protein
MGAHTLRLITAYRRQEHAYERVLELACDGLETVRSGGALGELHEINRHKERMLAEVGRIDGEIDEERRQWRTAETVGAETADLEQLLARIAALIELILSKERETDRWIAHGVGLGDATEAIN